MAPCLEQPPHSVGGPYRATPDAPARRTDGPQAAPLTTAAFGVAASARPRARLPFAQARAWALFLQYVTLLTGAGMMLGYT
ncbi:hypothetical protein [Streptomyces sp. NPDC058620]|uniref:hypothetical protein n=1 Tax=Streptomyces sp. NPDC058620 TaxID=3346560 RepID=UPI003647D728